MERGGERLRTPWKGGKAERGLERKGKTEWEEVPTSSKSQVLASFRNCIKAQQRSPEGPVLGFSASTTIGTTKDIAQ